MKKLNIAIIGYKFMGKAHSNAWRKAPYFFDLNVEPVLKVACGRHEASLKELSNKLEASGIKNVKIIKGSEQVAVPFEKEYFDFFLLYDVFHLLDKKNREAVLSEAYRVLKKEGILSYHATHIGSYDTNLEEVQQQIKMHGFRLKEEFRKPMFHWRWIAEGLVFNYGK